MKTIETNGISYLERLGGDWYFGTDYTLGDLYEAEEVFRSGGTVKPNRVIFVRFPEGKLTEPVRLGENQYFGRPFWLDGSIYLLLADFGRGSLQILNCGREAEAAAAIAELPLSEVRDCYNLLLSGSPLMLTRQGGENRFEIVWPRKLSFPIGNTESFLYREGERLFFSRWFEDPDYREELVVRAPDGSILEIAQGSVFSAPDGESWLLK